MRNHILIAICSILYLSGCFQSDRVQNVFSDKDLIAIDSLRAALESVIEAGDAAAYADLCIDDVQLLHPDFPIVTGREELISHNAPFFESFNVKRLDLTPVEIYGTNDLAYEVGTQSLDIEPSVDGFSSSRKYLHVMRRGHDGQWRFVALMSSDS
jgi:FMN-dependent NADH-azoreductase